MKRLSSFLHASTSAIHSSTSTAMYTYGTFHSSSLASLHSSPVPSSNTSLAPTPTSLPSQVSAPPVSSLGHMAAIGSSRRGRGGRRTSRMVRGGFVGRITGERSRSGIGRRQENEDEKENENKIGDGSAIGEGGKLGSVRQDIQHLIHRIMGDLRDLRQIEKQLRSEARAMRSFLRLAVHAVERGREEGRIERSKEKAALEEEGSGVKEVKWRAEGLSSYRAFGTGINSLAPSSQAPSTSPSASASTSVPPPTQYQNRQLAEGEDAEEIRESDDYKEYEEAVLKKIAKLRKQIVVLEGKIVAPEKDRRIQRLRGRIFTLQSRLKPESWRSRKALREKRMFVLLSFSLSLSSSN
ncbi:hypothetical protein BT69DRAFT_1062410 [Atractiella rhizophila]|nr:hypothetical protein BT69DRAFT_1062410 [Atractiella rhizophila]